MDHFRAGVLECGLDVKQMVQISMDGPNVNWAFIDLMKKALSEDFDSTWINIGSCGLHIVHNSFKAGVTSSGWIVSDFLSLPYYLFKDSPERKGDCVKASEFSYASEICEPWVAGECACLYQSYGDPAKSQSLWKLSMKKQSLDHQNKSYEVVATALQDKLLSSKLHFFKCIAGHLQPFLSIYQTDRPMVCFSSQDLSVMVSALMRRFIQSDKITPDISDYKLAGIASDHASHLTYKKVDVGFLIEKHLKEASKAGIQTPMQALHQCRGIESLVQVPNCVFLVRNLLCLRSKEMATNPDVAKTKFKKVIALLSSNQRVKDDDCDQIIQQCAAFVDSIPAFGSEKFMNFTHTSEQDRVDELLQTYMGPDEAYAKLVKLLLVLSHGQASVETGFLVNKEIEIENLKEQSLVAQRLICDHVKAVDGLLNIDISKPLLLYAGMARQRYDKYLEDEGEKKKTDQEKGRYCQNWNSMWTIVNLTNWSLVFILQILLTTIYVE